MQPRKNCGGGEWHPPPPQVRARVNLAIRDDSKAIDDESSRGVELAVTPVKSYDVIIYGAIVGHENVYINNSSHNRVKSHGRFFMVFCLVMTHQLIAI